MSQSGRLVTIPVKGWSFCHSYITSNPELGGHIIPGCFVRSQNVTVDVVNPRTIILIYLTSIQPVAVIPTTFGNKKRYPKEYIIIYSYIRLSVQVTCANDLDVRKETNFILIKRNALV
jgi:hypothetical protein